MAMMAYRATMFMIFFNYSMMIATSLISPVIFPGVSPEIDTFNNSILSSGLGFTSNTAVSTITTLMLTAGVLALFAFSLLIPTIPFVFLFFGLNASITSTYLWQIPLPAEFKLPLTMGVLIIYYIGITQYAARSSFQGS